LNYGNKRKGKVRRRKEEVQRSGITRLKEESRCQIADCGLANPDLRH